MLPIEHRLKRDKDFQVLFKSGKGAHGSVCGAKWKRNGLGVSRFAVVVGTKVSKKAVVRNRLRRQIREMIRLRLGEFKPGYDLVLIVKAAALGKKHEELEWAVLSLLKKTPVFTG
ncbi:MAG: ribonuclease P protein component [Candidatus Uhrbacteria bacterium]|nr:ribonuclease P protein component [Patescibacteria group bacterium]MBU1907460.1 ribonuclease P protein component [Patescibacteria group bacterium]